MPGLVRGTLVEVALPLERLSTGTTREQAGERPAIVVQDETAFSNTPLITLVPVTTTQGAVDFPGTMVIMPTQLNKLREPSIAMVFQITSVDRKRIIKQTGKLDSQDLAKLSKLIKAYLGL